MKNSYKDAKNYIISTPGIWGFRKEDGKRERQSIQLKFIYSEKATKFCEISTIDLTITT